MKLKFIFLVLVTGILYGEGLPQRIEALRQALPAVLKVQKQRSLLSYKSKFQIKGAESKKIKLPDEVNYLYKEIYIPKGFEFSEKFNGTLTLSRAIKLLSAIEVKEKLMQKQVGNALEKGSGTIKPYCGLVWDLGEFEGKRLGLEGSWTGSAKNSFVMRRMVPASISTQSLSFDNVTVKLNIKY